MNITGRRRFTTGLSAGVLVTLLAALVATLAGHHLATESMSSDAVGATVDWVWRNLGFSLPVFTLVLVLYVMTLERLRQALADSAPLEDVAQADHLSDVWTSLFFGVGVIWTAIGMRGALVQALAVTDADAASGGVVVLERMVEGDPSVGDSGHISRRRRLVRSLLDSIERGDYRAAKPFLDRIWPQVREEAKVGITLVFDAEDRDV